MKKSTLNQKILTAIAGISITIILITIIIRAIFQDSIPENTLILIILLAIIPLQISGYFLYKSFYPKKAGEPQSFFIPKFIGMGITINPNHPLGTAIWILIGLFVIVLLGSRLV
ncbi:MAG: hypothetical protein LBV67_12610 [Streptococcaceae bacterium]|jgi:hypothetical protein|nr:hypothetical protein [Streptococcaceae bacterium]